MPYLISFEVRVVLPNEISSTQLDRVAEQIKDSASAVHVHQEFNRTIKESHPQSSWHIHDGSEQCTTCIKKATDGKSADNPTGQ